MNARHFNVTSRKNCIALLLTSLVFVALSAAVAQGATSYEISWYTIDNGGETSVGGSYTLTGTIAQPDAGTVMTGGSFTLSGGFWPGTFGCIVNFYDLDIFCEQWLQSEPDLPANLDDTGSVDFADYSILADYWLGTCPPDWPLK